MMQQAAKSPPIGPGIGSNAPDLVRRARRFRFVAAALCLASASPLFAQKEFPRALPPRPGIPNPLFPEMGNNRAEDQHGPSLFVVDRQTTRSLESSREFIEQKEYARAIPLLQRILDNSEDFGVVEDRGVREVFRSAKQDALDLLGSMPKGGLDVYEREYGALARQLLEQGATGDELATLKEVSRRFLHTAAGGEATYRLVASSLDRGEPLTAVLYIEALRETAFARQLEPMLSLKEAIAWYRSGNPKAAVRPLLELQRSRPESKLEFGGREVELFKNAQEAAAWLATHLGDLPRSSENPPENWTMALGGPTRDPGPGSVPFGEPQWTLKTLDGTINIEPKQRIDLAEHARQYRKGLRDSNVLTIPAAQPIISGDVIVYRTLRNIRAAKLSTGELLWESAVTDPHYAKVVEQGGSVPISLSSSEQIPLNLMLRERSWRDVTWNGLSSDGKNVFALEDLGFWWLNDLSMRAEDPNPLSARFQNRLTAYDVATGKLQWEIGGPRGERSREFAGTFFLGAPLPVGSNLYCLGEIDGEIRLIVLDSRTGKSVWVQRLMFPDARLQNYPYRRIAGTAPSLSNGILVCPTTAGAVFGIDLDGRKLLWVFRYPTEIVDESISMRLKDVDEPFLSEMDEQARWLDGSAMISDGHVLVTPRDSNVLYCLNMTDGSLVWKRPRNESLYVADVYKGRAILVGRSQVEAVSLADKSLAWRKPVHIPRPNGRGIRHGNMYVVPLETGEIASIDLESGTLHARTKIPGGSVGNLISVRETIVSQTEELLVGFQSLEASSAQITRKLELNPDDAEALSRRGEIRLHLGQLDQALDDLRRSVKIDPESRGRFVLAAQLLQNLKNDFARHRTSAAELESLIRSAQQRLEFHSVMASGLAETGDPLAAWNEYLKLSGMSDELQVRVAVDDDATARGDRWITSRVAALYEKSDEKGRESLNRVSEEHLDQLLKGADPAALKRFAAIFESVPAGIRARRELVERLDTRLNGVAVEFELDHLRKAADPRTAGWATARLAQLFVNNGYPEEAAPLLDEIAEMGNSEPLLDGKTAGDVVAELKKHPDAAKGSLRLERWPARHLVVKRTKERQTAPNTQSIPLRVGRGPYFENWSFELQRVMSGEFLMVGRDGDGVARWKYQIDPELIGTDTSGGYLQFGRTHGHLIVVLLRGRLFALDAVSSEGPKLLWSKKLYEDMPIDPTRRPRLDATLSGPLTDRYVCYRIGSVLYAADALTGDVLWERRNTSPRSQYVGDNELIVTRPLRGMEEEALVMRATDGGVVSNKPLPIAGTALQVSSGRNSLIWTNLPLQSVLSLADSFSGRVAWQREFGPRALFAGVGEDEIAVLEPGENNTAKLTILSIAEGRPRVEATISEIEKPQSINGFFVCRSQEVYALFAYTPIRAEASRRLIAQSTTPNDRRANNKAFGFDRATGKQIWAVSISDSFIDPSQLPGLPVAFLKSSMHTSDRTSPRIMSSNLSVLDLRNGQLIYDYTDKKRTDPVKISIDRSTWTISLESPAAEFEITLTDVPLTDPPPARATGKREPVRAMIPTEPLLPVPAAEPPGAAK
ncbi:MAG: PQQ-binding-like beta-propeller repeat protein [Planctomycetaceae bacterium]